MHTTDHAAFVDLLDEQAKVFSKPKPSDDLVQSYWHALRDVSIQTIRDMAVKHTRYGKFFPKPFELRPREDKPPVTEDAASRSKFEAAVRFSAETWAWLRERDPAEYEHRLREAQLARLEVTTPKSSPAYPQVLSEANSFALAKLRRWETAADSRKGTEGH